MILEDEMGGSFLEGGGGMKTGGWVALIRVIFFIFLLHRIAKRSTHIHDLASGGTAIA